MSKELLSDQEFISSMKYARNLIWGRSKEGKLWGVRSNGLKHPGIPSI